MAAATRKSKPATDSLEGMRRPRNDPGRLKAFADRLNLMLDEIGLPERGRAKVIRDRIGVGGTTAANWLRGESYPSFEELGRMRRLGVDPLRLLTDGANVAPSKANRVVAAGASNSRLTRLIGAKQVFPITDLRTGDGQWDHTAFPNSIWRQLIGRDLAGFVLMVMKGDSMGERIKDGTPLLIDTNITQIVEDNGAYALLVGDAVLIRRVQRRLQGGFLIVGDNPAVSSETISQFGKHTDDAPKGNLVLVLGQVLLAIQKL